MKLVKHFFLFFTIFILFIALIGCKDNVTQQQIDDYHKGLEELEDYKRESNNTILPLHNERIELIKKRVEAIEAEDFEKAQHFMVLELNQFEELFEALKKIYVPEIAKDYHVYLTGGFLKERERLLYFLNSANEDFVDFDKTNYENLRYESEYLFEKANQELKNIENQFNQRAEELGLPPPYPF